MGWKRTNKLKLNPDKMEVQFVGSDLALRSGNAVVLDRVVLPWKAHVRSLGAPDPVLFLNVQVAMVARNALFSA